MCISQESPRELFFHPALRWELTFTILFSTLLKVSALSAEDVPPASHTVSLPIFSLLSHTGPFTFLATIRATVGCFTLRFSRVAVLFPIKIYQICGSLGASPPPDIPFPKLRISGFPPREYLFSGGCAFFFSGRKATFTGDSKPLFPFESPLPVLLSHLPAS